MTPSRWQRLETVFERVLDLPPAERLAVLDRDCADDPDLRDEILRMLGATSPDASLAIEQRFVTDAVAGDHAVGTRCGPYRLVARLGDGGSGTVYLADRADGQFQQQVAVKLIRGTRVWPALMARVRTEREALALLQHPNIARLFDAGSTDDEVPFLVMEFVDGVPITEHCATHGLGLEARLRLFLVVCVAVQYAHGRLVVHRDLKPSNVFVTHDGDVRLLDFGIAKLLSPSSDQGAITVDGQRPLTPDYAAPEQLAGATITTATDVYGLGVLLCELITGERPARAASGAHAVEAESVSAARILGRATTPLAAPRTWRDRLRRDRSDLHRVVAKALHVEPGRRYASAEQLGEEVERFLKGRPVHARPDSLAYRTSRFVKRNWLPVSAAVAAMVLIATFAGVAGWQARALARERDAASQARDRAEDVVRTLVDVFETTNPDVVAGADALTVRAWLDDAERRVLASLDDDLARATMQGVFGRIRLARTQVSAARDLLQAALESERQTLGPGARQTLATQLDLIDALVLQDDVAAMKSLHADVMRQLDGREGEEPALLARALAVELEPGKADIPALERAVALFRRHVAFEDPKRTRSLVTLALAYASAERHGDAERTWHEVLADLASMPGRGSAAGVMVHNDYATWLSGRGRADEAEAQLVEARTLAEAMYGPRSFWHATIANNLAAQRARRGDVQGANAAFRDAHEQFVAVFGRDHWQSANIARNVAITYLAMGEPRACLDWIVPAARRFEASAPAGRGTLFIQAQVRRCEAAAGDPEGALVGWQALLPALTALPNGASQAAQVQVWMSVALVALGRAADAEPLVRAAASTWAATLDSTHPQMVEVACEQAVVFAALGRTDEARTLFTRCAGAYDSNQLIEASRRQRVRDESGRLGVSR